LTVCLAAVGETLIRPRVAVALVGVVAHVEENALASLRVLHFPILGQVPDFFQVEDCLLGEFNARILTGVDPVPNWVILGV